MVQMSVGIESLTRRRSEKDSDDERALKNLPTLVESTSTLKRNPVTLWVTLTLETLHNKHVHVHSPFSPRRRKQVPGASAASLSQ